MSTSTLLASLTGAPLSAGTALQEAATDVALLTPTAQRSIGTFLPQVVVKERHTDELEMTDHPVEAGGVITDHAFKLPAVVIIECGFGHNSDSFVTSYASMFDDDTLTTIAGAFDATPLGIRQPTDLKATYDALLQYQDPPTLLNVTTGKRVYTNMLLKTLVVETDVATENVLKIVATLRQVIMATTQDVVVSAPASAQAEPQNTQPITDTGAKQLTATTVQVGTPSASS